MAYTVIANIDEEGNVTFEVKGIKGTGCERVLEPFEKLGQVVEECKTPEYYQAEVDIGVQRQ